MPEPRDTLRFRTKTAHALTGWFCGLIGVALAAFGGWLVAIGGGLVGGILLGLGLLNLLLALAIGAVTLARGSKCLEISREGIRGPWGLDRWQSIERIQAARFLGTPHLCIDLVEAKRARGLAKAFANATLPGDRVIDLSVFEVNQQALYRTLKRIQPGKFVEGMRSETRAVRVTDALIKAADAGKEAVG